MSFFYLHWHWPRITQKFACCYRQKKCILLGHYELKPCFFSNSSWVHVDRAEKEELQQIEVNLRNIWTARHLKQKYSRHSKVQTNQPKICHLTGTRCRWRVSQPQCELYPPPQRIQTVTFIESHGKSSVRQPALRLPDPTECQLRHRSNCPQQRSQI